MASSLSVDIKQRVISLVREQFNLELTDFPAEIPPRTELGDLAFPVAFELAKRIKAATGEKKNPREIAAKLAEGLSNIPGVAKVEIAGAGYLNIFFDRAQMFASLVVRHLTPDTRHLTPEFAPHENSLMPIPVSPEVKR